MLIKIQKVILSLKKIIILLKKEDIIINIMFLHIFINIYNLYLLLDIVSQPLLSILPFTITLPLLNKKEDKFHDFGRINKYYLHINNIENE